MPVKTIHEIIYETIDLELVEVQSIINSADISGIQRRRDQMKEFLKNHEWNLDEYKKFIKSGTLIVKRDQPPLPSNLEMMKNLTKSAGSLVREGFERCTEAQRNKRYQICLECPYYRDKDERCGACGCYVKAKTYMKAWRCPLGKW